MAQKSKDIREYTVNELEKKIRDTSEELLGSRLKKKTGQLEKSHLLRELRREIARMKTILAQKKQAQQA
ncbi:MAG: 50S ribosomal protein L29 [Opitutales bacterium]|nr:50S ribosomal protein L29 [Opitutales bacterium]